MKPDSIAGCIGDKKKIIIIHQQLGFCEFSSWEAGRSLLQTEMETMYRRAMWTGWQKQERKRSLTHWKEWFISKPLRDLAQKISEMDYNREKQEEKRRGTVNDIFYCAQENVAGCSRKNGGVFVFFFIAEKGLDQTLSDNTVARIWKLLNISQLLHERWAANRLWCLHVCLVNITNWTHL